MIKKTALALFAAAACLSCLSFTACHGFPKPVSYYQNQDNEEVKELIQEYQQTFKDQVAEVYGDSAVLTDIDCVRVFPEKYDPGYKSYQKQLKGTLTIDGTNYEALYDCYNDELLDSVHTDVICSELIESLPLDHSKIIESIYPESTGDWDYGEQWKFPSRITSFDEAVTWENRTDAPIIIWIFTLEDVSGLTEADFTPIPQIQKVIDSTSNCQITIFSLADTEQFENLKEQMMTFSPNIDRAMYPTATEEDIASIFSKYHMTNMMKVGNDFDMYDEKPHALLFKKAR